MARSAPSISMTDLEKSPPLWRQLQVAVDVLLAVEAGQSGSTVMESVAPELRAGVQALAFHAWRQWGRARALRATLAKRAPPAQADALLCLALALIWDTATAPYDEFTLVNQTVEAAKKTASVKAQANFINACLRRFIREREPLLARTSNSLEAQWNHPVWWIKHLQRDHPADWQSLLAAANRHPPMTLRVNQRQVSVDDYLGHLRDAGIAVSAHAGARIGLAHAVPVLGLPGFAKGWVSVQDGAAQLAAPLLLAGSALGPDARVLDACAAPGGKTAHLLELCDAQVTALELDAQRAQKIGQTLQRLGLQAQVVSADAANPAAWWDGQAFDRILLDAPCTASGIVRRHPDIRWLRRDSDLEQLATTQRKILAALWPLLKPGGSLLFCTCSIFRLEGDQQVQSFLANNKDARLLPSPGHLLPQTASTAPNVADNALGDHDGFFYALFEKTSM
jgi:16S rRNA (cytosine967-C5)-methyltransferase